ncbi:porin family protein [Cylindrospermopsis raciborskii LB2897]|nr:porin family protein [Cylindrospermopsis raciborskii LB2897]
MKIYSYLLFPTVLASLAFTTSVKAEEVSTKAADLMGGSNLLAQSSDPGFTQTTTTPSATLYTGGDSSNLPASNYFYIGASLGRVFPGDVNVKGKVTDAARIRQLQNARIPNEIENNVGLYSGNQWNIVGGYQWENNRVELEFGNASFGLDELKPVPGKLDAATSEETGNLATSSTPKTPLSDNINMSTALLNGYYDISTGSKFRPYIGAGIGFAFISHQPFGLGGLFDNGTSFAYQAKLGAQYEIVKKGNVFAELKYLGSTGYTSNKADVEVKLGSLNSFGLAVGYRQGL